MSPCARNQPEQTQSSEASADLSNPNSIELYKTLEQHLSPRQVEILVMMLQGQSRSEIAAQLNLSVRTIDAVRARLMDRLKAKNNADLVLKVFALVM